MEQASIVNAFNNCFRESENTVLVGGADEPWYLPASENHGQEVAVLYCRSDYAASALHEIAHWCLAGPARRRLADFGFTYLEPPRSHKEQVAFFNAELRTQSLERVFSRSAKLAFRVSADNFDSAQAALVERFARQVFAYASVTHQWMAAPAGARARQFNEKLMRMADEAVGPGKRAVECVDKATIDRAEQAFG